MSDMTVHPMNTRNEVVIQTESIDVSDRVREDLGDISSLVESIREYGILEPIVVARNLKLCMGMRRLSALKKLGIGTLLHGQDFIWLDERNSDPLRMKAVELEENIRRKDLSWVEVVKGKKELLLLMQKLHGIAESGGRTRGELTTEEHGGFGVRKLAAMLGESAGGVSQDIQLASILEQIPALATMPNKSAVLTKLRSTITTVEMLQGLVGAAPDGYTLHEDDFLTAAQSIPDNSVDLIYTDLPYGVELDEMAKHSTGISEYQDFRTLIVGRLPALAMESFRVLKEARFAVFWFGFNYYHELLTALRNAGFHVNPVPFIWYKGSGAAASPLRLYGNSYEQAIVARKCDALFIQPGMANSVQVSSVATSERLHIAQQPVELVERFLKDMTTEGATVLDWMAGSGTTGVAAVKNKRRVIMAEKDASACTVIKARMVAKR